MNLILTIIVVIQFCINDISSQCTVFDQIPELNYDRRLYWRDLKYRKALIDNRVCKQDISGNKFRIETQLNNLELSTYHLISENGARPLGFVKETQFHSPSSGPTTPCFSAENLEDGRQVEVMYQTVPTSTLCVRVKGGEPDEDFGCREKFRTCLMSRTSTIEFEFYCAISEGCSESNVNFWVRVVTGPPYANDTEGMWCHNRDSIYPESLASIPDFVTPGPTPPTQTGSTFNICLVLLISTLMAAILSLLS